MIGKGMPSLVRRALARARDVPPTRRPDAEVEAALAAITAHYGGALGRATQAYPGLLEGLERLAAMGFPLASSPTRRRASSRPHLERAGIAHYFALIVGGDDLPAKKPDPAQLLHVARSLRRAAPRELLMVGDSANDVARGARGGLPGAGRPVRLQRRAAGARCSTPMV